MVQRQGSGAVATAAVESGASLEAKAKRLIDEVVRPLIQVDGGQIELVSVSEARLIVRFGGSYLGCPGRPYALRVVERAARQCLLPDIQVAMDDDIGPG
jgi:Fe-S cluster biogenesis protein NfuA